VAQTKRGGPKPPRLRIDEFPDQKLIVMPMAKTG
jgi:hypothetical protein